MGKIITLIKTKPFLAALIIFVIANLIAAYLFVKPQSISFSDTKSYYYAIDFLRTGNQEVPVINRVLTAPLMLYLVMALGSLLGSQAAALIFINLIFYLLLAAVFYFLAKIIYQDEKIALFSAILLLTNFCILSFGLGRLVDMSGWFFFILSTYLGVNYYLKQDHKFFWLAIFASAIGFLFKEYALLGLVNFVFLILFSNNLWQKKIKDIIVAGAVFLLIVGGYHLFFYFKYHYSYLDWYLHNYNQYSGSAAGGKTYNFITLVKVVWWLFTAAWPIFLYGLWQEIKSPFGQRQKILLALLPASISFLFWPSFTQRVDFIIVPWLALIAGFGLAKIKNWLAMPYLAVYALANYNINWLLVHVNLLK